MIEVTIHRLGHHGDGIARIDGSDIYVPNALPGEVIAGEVSGDQLTNPKVVLPSGERVKAPCSHFKTCGGCSLQHASDRYLADWKVGIVRTALEGQGLKLPRFLPIATSSASSRRRATLSGRKTKKGALVGFHMRASDDVVAIPGCTLLDPDILAGMPAFEALTRIGATRSSAIQISVTRSDDGLDIDIRKAREADRDLLGEAAQCAETHGLARISWNGEVVAQRNMPFQHFGVQKVVPPPGGFLQATREGEAALAVAVETALAGSRHIVDLFAGCGTFALRLAAQADVLAVENDAPALEALDRGFRAAHGVKTIKTEVRDLFRRPLLASELSHFDGVVIDPPRAGAAAQFAQLAESKVAKIASVSCNPVTFARDALPLVKAGYRMDWIQVVDQFRWSSHVELVACFSRT
jgi:23S rRNA (uracil1939-C5)-methyltransferase